ncbi:MAG: iron ABC transporter permease [Desulfobacteraceae bacterium]|nr:iron ABC transporter permease [Desulfobacteraceae bacterium]
MSTPNPTWQTLRSCPLWRQLILLAAVLCLMVTAAAGMGHVQVGFFEVCRLLTSAITGFSDLAEGIAPISKAAVIEVRMPRILSAALVGGTLAVAGAVYQGILLNPLADPYTLGVSSGAAFGASIALLLNVSMLGGFSVPLFAFVGAAATLMVVMYLAASAGGYCSSNLILSGIIVAAILSAGISFLKYMADERVSVLVFWLMGSLASKTWADAGLLAAVAGPGTLVCVFFCRDLNLMSLGTRTAASMGVSAHRLPPTLLVCVSLMAAVCVSITGIIGFVGLLVPHLVRSVCGPDHGRLIPVSFFSGAILLLVADTVTRAVLPHELPIGVLTALLGGPFFCYVFRRRQMGAMGHGF